MAKYTTTPEVVEAITFEEFVKYAKDNTPHPHWHIPYNGFPITHENDKKYIVPRSLLSPLMFTPGKVLCITKSGNAFLEDLNHFQVKYQKL